MTDLPPVPPFPVIPEKPEHRQMWVEWAQDYARAFAAEAIDARAAAWEQYHGFDKYGVAAFIRHKGE